MSELSLYYESFKRGQWAEHDPKLCLCGGHGWALSDVDTWHECPIHYCGQLHPEYASDMAPELREAAEAESKAMWAALKQERQAPPPIDPNDIPF